MEIHRKIKAKIKKIQLEIFKFIFKQRNQVKKIDMQKVKKIIFMRNDNKIGDMLVNTIAFREIKKKYPDMIIDVFAGKDSSDILKNNPYVNEILNYKKGILPNLKNLRKIKERKYDIAIDTGERTTFEKIMSLLIIKANYNIGFKKKDYKPYDMTIEKDFASIHEYERYIELLKLFGIKNPQIKYDIFVEKESKEVLNNKKIKVVFNLYGANKHRTFTVQKAEEIIKEILKIREDILVVIIYVPWKEKEVFDIRDNINDDRVVVIENIKSVIDTIKIIDNCNMVVTPETGIVHIACALEKPQIAIYRNSEEKIKEWGPISDKAIVIKSDQERDINEININLLVNNIKKILDDLN